MMSLYAANNIATAINDLKRDGYAELRGIIQNSKGIEEEDKTVDKAAAEIGTEVVMRIPRDGIVQKCESIGKTVVEGAPNSQLSAAYDDLADVMIKLSSDTEGGMRFV
jgi:nitrogenase iron protein NifH